MLISVDLPAPLVPITAWISPTQRSSETASTAARPPKRRPRPIASSSGAPLRRVRPDASAAARSCRCSRRVRARAQARSARRGRSGPCGSAATKAMIVRPSVSCQCAASGPSSASDWNSSFSSVNAIAPITAPRRLPMPPRISISSTAPDSCQRQQLGVDGAVLDREQEAGEAGERAGDHERGELVGVGREARGAHALLVDADAGERMAEARARAAARAARRSRPARRARCSRTVTRWPRSSSVVPPIASTGLTYRKMPSLPPPSLVSWNDEVRHLRERERDHDEVDAARAQAERADDDRVGGGRAHRQRQRAARASAPLSPEASTVT